MGAALRPQGPDPSGPAGAEGHALLNPRAILRRHGIRANKRLGQHFLVDKGYLAEIVAAAEPRPSDLVLEIGPGLGVLTDALAQAVGTVVAVEVDAAMREILVDTVGGRRNVTIVAGDFLECSPVDLAGIGTAPGGRRRGYKVVANLPYQITSAALRHVLEAAVTPELVVVMVQREVADRITAGPGDMSILAVSVQFYSQPSRVCAVPATAFFPVPKVDSVVLRLDTHEAPPVDVPDAASLFRVVRAGFSQKRKQLRNSLSAGLGLSPDEALVVLSAAGIDSRRRAQTLSLPEWAGLARAMAATDR